MATSPSAPISPRTRANTALGFLLGLIVGITVPVLRESLAPKVRDPNGLEESAGAPFLGKARQGQWTGDLTLVRASLLTQSNLEPPSCLVVAAVDASPNAAPVAAGLASALALEGTRVLLVDADTPSPTSGLSELLSGAYTVDGTLGSAADGAYDIMRAESLGDKPTSFELHALCDSLKQKYDWVLVLAPAFKDHADAVLLAGAADGAVVVADQHRTSVKATTEVGDVLRRTGARVLGSVLV